MKYNKKNTTFMIRCALIFAILPTKFIIEIVDIFCEELKNFNTRKISFLFMYNNQCGTSREMLLVILKRNDFLVLIKRLLLVPNQITVDSISLNMNILTLSLLLNLKILRPEFINLFI
jgi:hypothetical protein